MSEKTIYGPVKSWRFGQSLGVDPIFVSSICSFNCIYCQLGNIQKVTAQRQIFVETSKVLDDFREMLATGVPFDVITFSGNGEPTLALNLGEMAREIKALTPNKPLLALTNATLLQDPAVQADLQSFDRVICKLDAPTDKLLALINRPAAGVSIQSIKAGILSLRQNYAGKIDLQMMFMPANLEESEGFIEFLRELKPDSVQLNTPTRPYPLSWTRENRGNEKPPEELETRILKTISPEEAQALEQKLKAETGLEFVSVYRS